MDALAKLRIKKILQIIFTCNIFWLTNKNSSIAKFRDFTDQYVLEAQLYGTQKTIFFEKCIFLTYIFVEKCIIFVDNSIEKRYYRLKHDVHKKNRTIH